MIPLVDAIDTGAWLRGEGPVAGYPMATFQMKVVEFSKLDMAVVDSPELIHPKIGMDANIWLFRFDVVNLCKEPLYISFVTKTLRLVDSDGFEFDLLEDSHLCCMSDFAKKSGLFNFFTQDLPPKIKKSGAIIFELPEMFDDLSIKVKNGSLTEV